MKPSRIEAMDSHNKLLLVSIAAVGVLGLAGARVAANLVQSPDSLDARESEREDVVVTARSLPEDQEYGYLLMEREFDGIEAIDVEMADADVILESTSSDRVTIEFYVRAESERWARELFERMELEVETTRGVLEFEADDPDVSRWEWEDHRGFNATALIRVPEGLEIDVSTSDGDIFAGTLSGRASLASSDGDIFVDEATGERLEVHTSDGDIVIDRLTVGQASIRTSDGDVSLDYVDAPIEVSSSDGDIVVEFAGAHEAEIDTGDGDVVLVTPPDFRASFRLEGEDLDIARGVELQGRLHDDVIEGNLNGGGPRIEVRTGDGSISLRSAR